MPIEESYRVHCGVCMRYLKEPDSLVAPVVTVEKAEDATEYPSWGKAHTAAKVHFKGEGSRCDPCWRASWNIATVDPGST